MSRYPRPPILDSELDAAGIPHSDRLLLRQLEQSERPWSAAELDWVQCIGSKVRRAAS